MRTPLRLAPTKRDGSSLYTTSAIAWLMCANDTRHRYARTLREAIDTYGDTDSAVISSIYADHFPESVKQQLRGYARIIDEYIDHAFRCWKLAGRHAITLSPYLQEARVIHDRDGREMVSYY